MNAACLNYLAYGMLGDFVYQLSVVNEIFLFTGKKGCIYFADKYRGNSSWAFGVERAYEDLKEIVLSQPYVSDFKIHTGEEIDINLSVWRDWPGAFKTHAYETFKKFYTVEWGSHKWLELPIEKEFENIILLSATEKRPNDFFDYNSLKKYNKQILFATTDKSEYHKFRHKSEFDLILFRSLKDYWVAINSCFLFVSTFGSFLCAAHGMHKNHIALLPNSKDDVYLYKNLPNLKWFKTEQENNLDE